MFYHNLGGSLPDDLTGNQGLIENIQFFHWSGTEFASDPLRELKTEDDRRVDAFVLPAEFRHQGRLENADDLPIDVIDGRGEEEQGADDPALIADFGR
jgi:hypothetical protein